MSPSHHHPLPCRRGAVWAIAALAALGVGTALLAQQPAAGHHDHHEHAAAAPAASVAAPAARPDHRMGSEMRILSVFRTPQGFQGNVAFDRESGRLWMMSFGPPANTAGPSVLYEAEVETGRVLRSAQLPFQGEFGPPVFLDGHLHQLVAHESRLYRIAVDEERFGEVVGELDLPTLDQVEHDDDLPLRFPFIGFRGVTATPDGRLLAHAQDLGELVEIDPQTGGLGRRVPTLRALEGIAAAPGREEGELLVIANSDPIKATFEYHVRRFQWRASHGTVPSVRYGKDALYWVLIDGRSGEILASLRNLDPRTGPASVTLVDHQRVDGAPYGRFTFLTTGDEGVFTVEWTPGLRS